jgi:hypothetical protein
MNNILVVLVLALTIAIVSCGSINSSGANKCSQFSVNNRDKSILLKY